jgi:hypothetical protein
MDRINVSIRTPQIKRIRTQVPKRAGERLAKKFYPDNKKCLTMMNLFVILK